MKIIQKYILSFLLIVSPVQICAMDNEHQISNMQSIVAQQDGEQQKPTETDEQRQARWKRNEKVTSLLSYGSWCAGNILEMLVGSIGHAEGKSLYFTFMIHEKARPWIFIDKQGDAIVQAVENSDYDRFKESCLLFDVCASLFIQKKAPKSSDFIKSYKTEETFFYTNSNLLHIAAGKLNNNKIVKFLLQAGMDVNAQDGDGLVALHYASAADNLDSVELLLDCGAKTDYISIGSLDTPLTEAFSSNSARVANVLITRGANVEHFNSVNLSALFYAIEKSEYKFVETAKLLIKHGADINVKDEHGRTPLHHAIYFGRKDMLKLLLDAGANVDIQDNQGKKIEEISNDIEIQDLIAQARIDRAAKQIRSENSK